MDNDAVIQVEGLYKKFCINQRRSMFYGGMDVLRSMLGFAGRRDVLREKEIWALENISFEVAAGQTLGIVGVNGAGKSTLLRVLSGIYPPDTGSVSVRGPVGALIAAGAGFHPDMTGRENIYLNGAIVGLRKKEIDEKLEEIIEFAELGEFIDTPVRFYSSGMYVRLGFAIASNIRPRVLVIDEVLSVGDLSFQNKCFRKMKELRESVEAVLFVSHNLDHIRNICSDLIILDSGRIVYHGKVEEGIVKYQTHVDHMKKKSIDTERDRKARYIPGSLMYNSSVLKLEEIRIAGSKSRCSDVISTEDDVVMNVIFTTEKEIANPQFSVAILDDKDTALIWQINQDHSIHFDKLDAGRYQLQVAFKRPPLVPGVYKVNFSILDADSCEVLTHNKRFLSFVIQGQTFSRAAIRCESEWELEKS